MLWPTLSQETVYHVGTLRPQDTGRGGCAAGQGAVASREGHHLSVCLNPDYWRRVAELGDAPCWGLRRTGARFVDARPFAAESATRRAMLDWGTQGGLCTVSTRYAAYAEDTETGVWHRTLHGTLAEAEAESLDALEDTPRYEAIERGEHTAMSAERAQSLFLPHALSVALATPALEAASGFVAAQEATDALLCALSASLDIDGVWWAAVDGTDRGLIRRDMVSLWQVMTLP